MHTNEGPGDGRVQVTMTEDSTGTKGWMGNGAETEQTGGKAHAQLAALVSRRMHLERLVEPLGNSRVPSAEALEATTMRAVPQKSTFFERRVKDSRLGMAVILNIGPTMPSLSSESQPISFAKGEDRAPVRGSI